MNLENTNIASYNLSKVQYPRWGFSDGLGVPVRRISGLNGVRHITNNPSSPIEESIEQHNPVMNETAVTVQSVFRVGYKV